MKVVQINNLEEFDIKPIVNDSIEDGHRFLKKLRDEYSSGTNQFNRQGEALYGVVHNNIVVGIGGLNVDPYLIDKNFGRVRHIYVMREYRKKGFGKAILQEIIYEAKKHYQILGLRTNNHIADEMYCSMGFTKEDKNEYSTHNMNLNK